MSHPMKADIQLIIRQPDGSEIGINLINPDRSPTEPLTGKEVDTALRRCFHALYTVLGSAQIPREHWAVASAMVRMFAGDDFVIEEPTPPVDELTKPSDN
jgi:hypothetical protein